ncbi:MAG: hypothetical protein A2984_01605 [Omnitrophica WOR_2 bacterium RIFCSPLOWO2_01_FULL_41_12]|nr:MAG: hypothetical protein A2984_01605 [Omnitrophica WOR_2 bacterium RIFCSPLOWO2_01_FULL_41_12]
MSLWAFFIRICSFTENYHTGLLCGRLANISAAFIPVFFTHFSLAFTNREINKNKLLILGYFSAVFILIAGFTRYFIPFVRPIAGFNYLASPGPIYIFFTVMFFFYVIYSQYILIKGLKSSNSPAKQNQLKYVIFGTIAGYICGSTVFLGGYGIDFKPWPVNFIFIYTLLVAYAILKHKLMDINVVIKKGIIYSTLATLLTAIYLIFVILIERLFHQFIGYTSVVATILAAFTIAIFFIPLKNYIQTFVDKLFFKGTLDSLAKEKELMQDELMRSERLKAVATLAAGMAHEIKNPLTAIKTFTEHLTEKKDDPAFITKFERIVGGEVDKINRIVHQLLDFAKPAPLKLEKININNLLDDTISLLSNDIIKHNIKLNKRYSDISTIQVDPNQLKQAFLNLLLNAIEAMPEGGELTVKTSKTDRNQAVEVIISDTGYGVAEKELPHIFDPFYSTKDKGTGLGLSITYEIIKKHNGRITVESKVGVGTKTKINLYVSNF